MGDEKDISRAARPRLLALFQKRIDGDDALLRLASLRFKEAGLGTEFYAETPEEMDWLLQFKPTPKTPAVIHLSRGINLFEKPSRDLVMEFAQRYKDHVFGLTIHDQIEITTRFDDYVAKLTEVAVKAGKVQASPCVFIEYAVGLEPGLFIEIFKSIRDLKRVSACIDVGHVGLWQTSAAYTRNHPGKDVFALTPHDPGLPEVIEDIESAVHSALDSVLHVINALGELNKPVHFHLHDGHPLSMSSPFGISDHLSFLDRIPIPFEYKGKRYLDPMFGPVGLSRIVNAALERLGPDRVSFSLEIHPTEGRRFLDNASCLFDHWQDKTNAERMNYWLSVLLQNHELVLRLCMERLMQS